MQKTGLVTVKYNIRSQTCKKHYDDFKEAAQVAQETQNIVRAIVVNALGSSCPKVDS